MPMRGGTVGGNPGAKRHEVYTGVCSWFIGVGRREGGKWDYQGVEGGGRGLEFKFEGDRKHTEGGGRKGRKQDSPEKVGPGRDREKCVASCIIICNRKSSERERGSGITMERAVTRSTRYGK